MTSRSSKGLDEGNPDTISFSRMTSGDSGWLWWRDTDFFLDEDTDRGKGLFLTNQQYEKRRYVYIFFTFSQIKTFMVQK